MPEKDRIRDVIVYKVVNIFGTTLKARLMDKLPLFNKAEFYNGVQCYVSSSRELRRSQRLFLPEVRDWLEHFKPGEVFYDIGANIGMFSLTVAKMYNGHVKTYAFEPSFSTFSALVHNVIGNGFGDIIFPFSLALGRDEGLHSFNYTDIASGAAVHTLDTLINQTGKEFAPAFKQQVISYSLDDLVRKFQFPLPTHIKIDVDGGEMEIIQGMEESLKKTGVKSVLVEVTETQEDDEQVKRLMDIFKRCGFEKTRDIPHTEYKTYPLVSDILFTKDWN
ncbi:MAG TPA: FkbM family methyltransferase [Anaerolineales bacterium]|nr:FkbM family methyltransferase [Anaerolineales bacterium]